MRGGPFRADLLLLQLTERQRRQEEELQRQQEAATEARVREEQHQQLEELEARRMVEAGYRNKVGTAAPRAPQPTTDSAAGWMALKGAALRGWVLGLRAAIPGRIPPQWSFPEGWGI